jgi:hypothetical protein
MNREQPNDLHKTCLDWIRKQGSQANARRFNDEFHPLGWVLLNDLVGFEKIKVDSYSGSITLL